MSFMLIKIVSGYHPAQEMSKNFDDRGGVIGRSEECDWVLFDMTRIVSKQHAAIVYHAGQFFLEDISTNGVMIAPEFTVLGRGNRKALAINDSFRIGDFVFHVESMTLGASDLFAELPEQNESDLLSILSNSPAVERDTENNIKPLHITSFDEAPITTAEPLNLSALDFDPKPLVVEPLNMNRGTAPVVNALPDDWELSGVFNLGQLADVPLHKAPESTLSQPHQVLDSLSDWDLPVVTQAAVVAAAVSPQVEKNQSLNEGEATRPETASPAPIDPMVSLQQDILAPTPTPTSNLATAAASIPAPVSEPAPAPSQVASPAPLSPQPQPQPMPLAAPADDAAETSLYLNLGLPPELSVRLAEGQLEQDVATIIQATTAGLMKLLQARSQFKHESRLAMTQVQSRSNNPLKFCIEASDALELMLVKKKAGYLTPQRAYEEAIHDLQLHQTAFISGLQAAMSGILKELAPEQIEQEVKSSMLGKVEMVAHAQAWRVYKEKQHKLSQAVIHNFSEVMGKYFSDAYTRFIAENSTSTEKPDV